ncbi:hypothetical protein, partial [Escherichia coli]
MISLKAPHNNLMPYTQQSILNTVDLPLYF